MGINKPMKYSGTEDTNRRTFLKGIGAASATGLTIAGAPTVSASGDLDFYFQAVFPLVIEDGDTAWIPDDDEYTPQAIARPGDLSGAWIPVDQYSNVAGNDWGLKLSFDHAWHSNASSSEFGTVSYTYTLKTYTDDGMVANSMGGEVWTDIDSPEQNTTRSSTSIIGYDDSAFNPLFQTTELELEFDFSDSDITPSGGNQVSQSYYFATPDYTLQDLVDLINFTDQAWDQAVKVTDKLSTVNLTSLQKIARVYMALQAGADFGEEILSDEGDLVADAAINGISAFADLVEDETTFEVGNHDNLSVEGGGPTFVINPE
ncbi:hypothetical protein HALLA_03870 (plasmid) [Halostagnicola larsenii XH-48]|uniref:Twin-arginine translocation signal domain-containing protein n=1 Tax=Halostagnicola larsenii XH-48 TaxID=797299 RepID=W0JS67_9EURY|nr:hypothetical protein [Halostagnicola larsenii]AHG01541.1 hypothetical protein HALLA_03870 [Halostagnicola larsenii XH-48]